MSILTFNVEDLDASLKWKPFHPDKIKWDLSTLGQRTTMSKSKVNPDHYKRPDASVKAMSWYKNSINRNSPNPMPVTLDSRRRRTSFPALLASANAKE